MLKKRPRRARGLKARLSLLELRLKKRLTHVLKTEAGVKTKASADTEEATGPAGVEAAETGGATGPTEFLGGTTRVIRC